MKHLLIPFLIGLSLSPAMAQEATPPAEPPADIEEGVDLLERGARMLLQGLMNEMEPALRDLSEKIDDLNAYHPPEILPNGDIIIRRKTPLQIPPGEGEIDL